MKTARLAICTLLLSTFFVSLGCSRCSETVQKVASPDGRTIAIVDVSGQCGGATVGYSTGIGLIRPNRGLRVLGEGGGITMIRGRPEVKLTWNSNTSLTMQLTLAQGIDEVLWRQTQVLDVAVHWVVIEEAQEPNAAPMVP